MCIIAMGRAWSNLCQFGSIIFTIWLGAVWLQFNKVPELPNIPLGYWGPGSPVPDDLSIQPFTVNIAERALRDFEARLDNSREQVASLEGSMFEYGSNSHFMKQVIDYWKNEYKWEIRQKYLNKFPQFKTQIAGLNIHFIHVKPDPKEIEGKVVVPILIIHGWPGSVREFYDLIPLLENQKLMPDVAYEIVVPSLPGYGWSDAPRKSGMATAQMGNVFKELMSRLGHERFVVQGGDWGSIIGSRMTIFHPDNILGFHSNMCSNIGKRGLMRSVAAWFFPSWFLEEFMVDRYTAKLSSLVEESGYFHLQATKPDSIGVALTDSPVGLAAYILHKFSSFSDSSWQNLPDGGLSNYNIDFLLDNVMIYWFSNSITTSMRLYAEEFSLQSLDHHLDDIPVHVPTGCTRFEHELVYTPLSSIKTKYQNLWHVTYYPQGGHFPAVDSTQVLAEDINMFVKTLISPRES